MPRPRCSRWSPTGPTAAGSSTVEQDVNDPFSRPPIPQRRGTRGKRGVVEGPQGLVAACAEQRRKVVALDVGTVRASAVEGGHPVEMRVEPGDRKPGAGEFDGEREADIPLADDADAGGPV